VPRLLALAERASGLVEELGLNTRIWSKGMPRVATGTTDPVT
jgi:hypothetical protein